ncbi:pre-mRNA-processing factor 17 [Quaeritorhiza haematococci]|nr:pre-mRNA-processing factor 17 [Quaeritorhiza haematococci]
MDHLAGYASGSDDESSGSPVVNHNAPPTIAKDAPQPPPTTDHSLSSAPLYKKIKVDLAPEVSTEDLTSHKFLTAPTTKEITHNVPYADLSRPVAGPDNPFVRPGYANRNVLTGFVEEHAMSDHTFNTLSRTYNNFGYTLDPNGLGESYIGNVEKAVEQNGATIYDPLKKNSQKKRKAKGDPSQIDGYMGPWAGYEGENVGEEPVGPTDEERAQVAAASATGVTEAGSKAAAAAVSEPGMEKTIFHGKSERDYLGRTFIEVPTDVDVDLLAESGTKECYIPKRCIHTWSGHTKGVNSIKFFPKSAHLLLSASMDNKVKIWDVYHQRKCLRTYLGHSKAVRDVCFSNDGRRFLSASYDKWIKLWDTETGKCISSFTTKRIPYCITFNPDEDKQHIFLTGCADKKVYQFDMNTGEITQEYDQHLGAVNTITFVDDNRRFVTTSDDKTLRAWEYDIPVVIKYVAEPDMHSMPAVKLSPNRKWLACQSLDNQIVIYSAKDRFRLNRNKVFRGHLVAGYACQPAFSPDGRFVTSGDSEGKVWFWDWKTCKVFQKFKAHDKVVVGVEWHPHEQSKVATCSWDGTIK